MGIRIRHDAAAVALPANSANRKYGQQLVMQQQQQKYQGQQAGYDRLFQLGRDQQQNAFQIGRDNAQNDFVMVRDKQQNAFQMQRDQALGEQQLQQQQMEMRQKFMEDARKQSSGMIMDGIKNGEYDPVTARKLQQNLVNEAEALGNPQYDATQRAEALQKLRAERALLSANRLETPKPTREEELQKFLGPNYEQYKDQPWVPDGKGGFAVAKDALVKQQKEMELQQKAEEKAAKMRPKSFQEFYSENEDKFQKDLDATMTSMRDEVTAGTREGEVTPETALAKMQEDYKFRQKALGRPETGTPTPAPALPGEAPAPAAPSFAPGSRLADQATALGMNPSKSILEATPRDTSAQDRVAELLGQQPVPRGAPPMPAPQTVTAQLPDPGMPPAPAQEQPLVAQRPDAGMPPAPQPQSQPAATATSRFTPPGMSPKEAAARQQILDLPADQRVTSLMPYASDPLLKGRTVDEALADPEVRKIYDEEIVADAQRRGVQPPEYREAMLAVFDEALTGEILNGGVSMPQQNYAGMHVDAIKDPKAKAEVDKMPRPKSPDEVISIRGPYFVDPNGIIRSTKKQA